MAAVAERVFVAPISFGLGDLVVSLPAVQALVAAGRETWLVARAPVQELLAERIEGLAGVVREEDFDPDEARGAYLNLRDHPLQRDFWWGSEPFARNFGALAINEILARICGDFGVRAEFSCLRPLRARPRPEVRDAVLFVAASDGQAKRWPLQSWAALADALGRAGIEPRWVTDGGPSPQGIRAEPVPAPTPGDAVDLLASCRAVVGVDTGLTHIAVQQGTPTVALHRAPPVYFRPFAHARALVGEACDPACSARELKRAYNDRVRLAGFAPEPWECAARKSCLAAIAPDAVMDALHEILPR
jgi:ADP-heptose:LPS heptosyltransferase